MDEKFSAVSDLHSSSGKSPDAPGGFWQRAKT